MTRLDSSKIEERGRVQALVLLAVARRLRCQVARGVLVGRGRGVLDGAPQLEQVVEVPLQLFGAAADAGGAGDDAHALRQLELVHRLAQLLPVLALDAARDAAAARVVGHQHQVAAGQRDERGQRRALVAAFLLLDLDDQFLALGKGFLDGRAADVDAGPEVAARDFLERQEAVPLLAVVDETGFEGGFDPGDQALVDIGLALLATRGLDVDVDQFLAIDDPDPQLLGMGRVEQHALHQHSLRHQRRVVPRRSERGSLRGAGRGESGASDAPPSASLRAVDAGHAAAQTAGWAGSLGRGQHRGHLGNPGSAIGPRRRRPANCSIRLDQAGASRRHRPVLQNGPAPQSWRAASIIRSRSARAAAQPPVERSH